MNTAFEGTAQTVFMDPDFHQDDGNLPRARYRRSLSIAWAKAT
jgi:hypothetical protein